MTAMNKKIVYIIQTMIADDDHFSFSLEFYEIKKRTRQ
jgi:hypothetical protein